MISLSIRFSQCVAVILAVAATGLSAKTACAESIVPGTGQKVKGSGDDFEDAKWSFTHNFPKSSFNIDKRSRDPLGVSSNYLWHESGKRGQPDIVKRVATPKGGLPGSKGALLMRTLNSGIPGYRSQGSQQDDLLFNTPSIASPCS